MGGRRVGLSCLALAGCVVRLAAQELSLDTLLPHIQRQAAEHVFKLPNYTCLETITRFERTRLRDAERIDTVRLEIAVIDGVERFAWPGASRFEETDLREMLGHSSGALAKGDFVAHARNILLSGNAVFSHPLAGTLQDHIRIDYSVPVAKSTYTLGSNGKSEISGYHGAIWVDPVTLDLMRIEIVADEPHSGVARALSNIEYQRTRLGESDVLLPASAENFMQHVSGTELRNRTEYTACRQYGATSSISFEEKSSAIGSSFATSEIELPAGLKLDLRLAEAIHSTTAVVGDLISARLKRPVLEGGRTLLPAGSVATGRIRKFERHVDPWPFYIVGLEFFEARSGDVRARFMARMDQIQLIPGMLGAPNARREAEEQLLQVMPLGPPLMRGVATFIMIGDRIVLPKDLDSSWRTSETPKRAGLKP